MSPSVMIVCDYSLDYLGGAQTALIRQARALAGEGWSVVVVAPDATQAFADDRPSNLATRDPRVRFTIPGLDLPMLGSRERLTRGLIDLGRDRAVDAIIVHSEFALAAAALAAAAVLDVPLLHTVHTYFWRAPAALAPAAPLVTAFHRGVTGLPGSPGYRGSSRINNALRSMTHRVAVQADAVLSPSRHQADALRRAGVERVRVLSNVAQPLTSGPEPVAAATSGAATAGTPAMRDTAATSRQKTVGDPPLTLVWAGRFAPEKRLEVALEAVRRVRAALGDGAVHLHVAGGDHAPEPGVTFHGRVSSEQVSSLIASADAALLTSLGFDNQPMIALEACARERPIVVVDPVLTEEFDGAAIGAGTGDAAGLARTLMELVGDPHRLRSAGEAARRYAAARQPSAHADQLAAIIAAGRAGTTFSGRKP